MIDPRFSFRFRQCSHASGRLDTANCSSRFKERFATHLARLRAKGKYVESTVTVQRSDVRRPESAVNQTGTSLSSVYDRPGPQTGSLPLWPAPTAGPPLPGSPRPGLTSEAGTCMAAAGGLRVGEGHTASEYAPSLALAGW